MHRRADSECVCILCVRVCVCNFFLTTAKPTLQLRGGAGAAAPAAAPPAAAKAPAGAAPKMAAPAGERKRAGEREREVGFKMLIVKLI